jgi:hypothetical protein
MVQPRQGVSVIMFSVADPIHIVADYSGGQPLNDPRTMRAENIRQRVFAPIHWLDRKIRPDKWQDVRAEGVR